MDGIKLATWRYLLIMFFLLTSVSVAIDCLDKIGLPFRSIVELILKNAVLPAIIVVGILLVNWGRKYEI